MAKPRWFSLVLRDVGLRGSGESGVARGDLRGAIGVGVTGDLRDRAGLDT